MDAPDTRVAGAAGPDTATTTAVNSVDIRQAERPEIRKNVILALLLVAQFMAVLDVTIVNVAGPAVRADLQTSGSALQFIIAGYTVAYSTLLITGARLGDRLGHARVFTAGIVGFTLMSLACGLAPTAGVLMGARLLQGATAAFMMPQVMSLIQRTFSGPERARAISLYAAVIAIGAVFGQVAGGLLVTADVFGLTWRPIFLVNVPIGVVLAVLVLRFLPRPKGDADRRFDILGVVSIMATVVCLVVPLVFGQQLGWPAWTIALLILVVPLAILCALHERRSADRDPILSREVVGAPGFGWILLFLVLMQSAFAGSLLAQALHFESGLGISALATGLLFVTGGLGFAAGSMTWRRFPARLHPALPVAGLGLAALGYLVVAWDLHDAAKPGLLYLVINMLLSAAFGFGFGPVLSMALSRVPLKFAGSASGVLVSTLQIGQLLGIAAYGTIYFALHQNPTAADSATAFSTTLCWAAGACAICAVCAVVFVRAAARSARTPG